MLRDLRVKIRNRYSRLSSCSDDEFLGLTKQFFEFIKQQPLVESVLKELMSRNAKITEQAGTHGFANIIGDTDEEAAALGFMAWSQYTAQQRSEFFVQYVRPTGTLSEILNRYRGKFLDPLFDYLDETIEDRNIILGTLIRYKHKAEW